MASSIISLNNGVGIVLRLSVPKYRELLLSPGRQYWLGCPPSKFYFYVMGKAQMSCLVCSRSC